MSNTEYSIMRHRDGNAVELIACNLSAASAKIRMEQLSEEFGQPILHPRFLTDMIVNETADEGCWYYYIEADEAESE